MLKLVISMLVTGCNEPEVTLIRKNFQNVKEYGNTYLGTDTSSNDIELF